MTREPRSLLEIAARPAGGPYPAGAAVHLHGGGVSRADPRALPEFSDERILGEPMGRDTVNAVGLAAAVFQKLRPGCGRSRC